MKYFVIPLGDKLPSFNEVKLHFIEYFNKSLKRQNINKVTTLTIHLCDNFVGSHRSVNLDESFVWHSPEIEDLECTVYDSITKNVLDTQYISCDFVGYNCNVEDIVDDVIKPNNLLNNTQLKNINEKGLFFYELDTSEALKDISIKIMVMRNIAYVIALLTDGILFSVDNNWHLDILPTNAKDFYTQHLS